jgi:hypothetical protein
MSVRNINVVLVLGCDHEIFLYKKVENFQI